MYQWIGEVVSINNYVRSVAARVSVFVGLMISAMGCVIMLSIVSVVVVMVASMNLVVVQDRNSRSVLNANGYVEKDDCRLEISLAILIMAGVTITIDPVVGPEISNEEVRPTPVIMVSNEIFSLGTDAVFDIFPKPSGEEPSFQLVSLNSGSFQEEPRSPSESLYFHSEFKGMIVTSRLEPDWLIASGLIDPPSLLGSEPSVV